METEIQARDPGRHPELLHDRDTCQCVRCRGFQKGHTINAGRSSEHLVKHGALASPLVLAPEAEAIADLVRPLMPVQHPSFEGELQAYSIRMARVQRALVALDKADLLPEGEEPEFSVFALEENLRRWLDQASKSAGRLGFTPESATKMMKDASVGEWARQSALLTQTEVEGASMAALEQARAILSADAIDGEAKLL